MQSAEEYAKQAEQLIDEAVHAATTAGVSNRIFCAQVYATLAQAAAIQAPKVRDQRDYMEVTCNCGTVSYHPQTCPTYALSSLVG